MKTEGFIDLTRGVYRLIYGGFITGRRINKVSIEAEAAFWRLHAICDDYGNFRADYTLLRCQAWPRRPSVTDEQVRAWTGELEGVKLITFYAHDGEQYGHICGFETLQPANKNGRRLQRHPMNPGVSGESGGIRGNPGESRESCASEAQAHSEAHTHTQAHSDAQAPEQAERAKPSGKDRAGLAGWLEGHGVAHDSVRRLIAAGLTLDQSEALWADSAGGARRRVNVFVAKANKAVGIGANGTTAAAIGAQLNRLRALRVKP